MIDRYDCSKIENYEELRRVQLVQLEILKHIDKFCREHKIKYSLAYGTILGAVRHGGFIPWDDDLDIMMLRKDYDRFLALWKDNEEYILQNHETNNDFSQSFTKIRKKNTAFVQETDLGKSYHKGIFVDIFPLYRVPEGKLKRLSQRAHTLLYQLYMRGFVPKNSGKLVRIGSGVLLKLHSKNNYPKLADKHLKKIMKYNDNDQLKLFDLSTVISSRRLYKHDLFDNLCEIKYEDDTFPVVDSYIDILKTVYGDYMKLPDEDKRTWFHRPVCISFDREYTENNDIQK